MLQIFTPDQTGQGPGPAPGPDKKTNDGTSLGPRLGGAPGSRKHTLSSIQRLAAIGLGVFLLVGFFWLFNKITLYYVAGAYVDEVAEVFDINKNLANAILWATVGATFVFANYAFSFSRRKRAMGLLGILLLLVGHSATLWYGTSHQFFERSGRPTKCYVVTRDLLRYGERPGIDQTTGRECRLVTPEIVERLRAYENGTRPQRITDLDPTYFDPRTGEPIVWYYKNKRDEIEIFNLMGFHPDTGEELLPISKEIVELYKSQIARRTPRRIDDPETYGFFDPLSGKPRIWYEHGADGSYDFYDGPGFDPHTGRPFSLVTSEFIAEWRESISNSQIKKCFIITRDSRTPVRYGQKPGIDPVTGRECRELSVDLIERLRESNRVTAQSGLRSMIQLSLMGEPGNRLFGIMKTKMEI